MIFINDSIVNKKRNTIEEINCVKHLQRVAIYL